jgi:isoaspartyl peptidase/L-asparaginase-like protein (Ntn-hydrolase superfamily)
MKKSNRKTFIKQSAVLAVTPFIGLKAMSEPGENPSAEIDGRGYPIVISTWRHGKAANKEAWQHLINGKSALDSVEAGVRIPEGDPNVTSVGYGGYPDETGRVTLDACIMDHKGNCGSVSYLENIKHPISVARKVMEKTKHIMLSGKGALDFALKQGFQEENLLTNKAKQAFEKWKSSNSKKQTQEKVDMHNHDTIGMLAIDDDGQIAGACTTSGLAWKLNGRVGDSPIIGAGLFVDGKVGAATATGKGESVIKIAGTAIIVELMRQGKHPQEACEEAIKRIASKQEDYKSFQVGFLAMNLKGQYGAYSIQDGFQYALNTNKGNEFITSGHLL